MAELQLYKQPTVNMRKHELFNKYATLRARAPVCLCVCVCACVHYGEARGGIERVPIVGSNLTLTQNMRNET